MWPHLPVTSAGFRSSLLGAAPELETNVALTARELEVLALLAEGASNKLIARRLGIAHGQVSRRIVVGEA